MAEEMKWNPRKKLTPGRPSELEEFQVAYVEAALWSSMDDDGRPLDEKYDYEDISSETIRQMNDDAWAFYVENYADIESNLERAGHDFWLTRNGHGAGFWDGDWPEAGDRLTENAEPYGSFDLYIGDDGQIYGQ